MLKLKSLECNNNLRMKSFPQIIVAHGTLNTEIKIKLFAFLSSKLHLLFAIFLLTISLVADEKK